MINLLIRFIIICVLVALTALLTPGFTISGIWALILGVIVIIVLDYIFAKVFNLHKSSTGKVTRGIIGFILMAVIIYVTQFFVRGFNVSLIAALIAALIYGVLDAIIPGETRET